MKPSLALAFLAAGSAFAGMPGREAPPAFAYVFGLDESGKRVGGKHDTTLLVLRNASKLRPLFITGRAVKGTVAVAIGEASDLGVADLLGGAARATGAFTVTFDRYASSRFDLARRVGTAWLGMEPRPALTLTAKALTEWRRRADRKKHKRTEEFAAVLLGTLACAERTASLRVPVSVSLVEGRGGRRKTPPLLILRADLTITGADLGLTGDDAGPIQVYLRCEGVGVLRERPRP